MSDKPTRSRRPLSAAQISARASGSSRPQAQRSVSSGGTARAQATTPVYRPLRYVGRGSFGVVVLAEELHTGEKVAIKRVHYDARLHNREVAILNSVLVDDPRHQQTSSTVGGSAGVSRLSGGAIGASFSPSLSASSSSHTVEDVHLWAGRHHPNIVELLDFYVTYDTSSEQALGLDMVGAGGTGAGFEFLSSHHPTEHRYPLSGGRGPTSPGVLSASAPLSAFAYLEMVMGYLPMDLCYMKKYFFRFHEIPSRIASSSASPLVSPVQAPTDLSSGELPECIAGRPPTSPKHPSTDCKGSSSCCHSSTGTSGGDFRNHLPLNWVKVVLFQLARALAFMHARHVCHRDLKPGNVLVDPHTGRVQLCDFGSAKQIMQPAEEKNVSYICSRYYRAPELLFGALHYGCAVDMWSFGCIAAELLRESGRPLFRGCTSIDQMAELFKVLGAPSKREMYAMNPQCAEALLRTHAMHRNQSFRHRPHSGARGCGSGAERRNRSCGLALGVGYQAEEEEDDELHSGLQQAEYDAENHGDFLRDALDDGILSQASVSPGMATGSQVPSSPTDPRHYKRAFSERPSSVATATLDDVTPTPFEEYYDVLKVRAIPWRMLFPADTPVEAVTLVASLLCYTPEKRLTAAEVVEHAFFDDLFSAAAASPETRIYHDTATSMASGATPFPGEDPDAASAALRLPNGHLMPLSMFQVTEVERGLYTDTFLARMARQAELVAAARKQEGHS
ncbi:protein kinase, putative [Leishmania panamensis]|uniref:Protein kinase, putative n=1 Tax=Leishmania panamensis TaxID=5679 RepID=A0A088S9M6_LEIPA|nr:protein kinase, putative [Leishmania panamensis]AIN98341.1 protein kinase, putative [Leishmania panamensis]